MYLAMTIMAIKKRKRKKVFTTAKALFIKDLEKKILKLEKRVNELEDEIDEIYEYGPDQQVPDD